MTPCRDQETAVYSPSDRTIRGKDESTSERLHAVGSFIWKDSGRVLAAGSCFNDDEARTVECKLRGGSMESVIPARSRIRIAFKQGPYEVGQVIAFMIGTEI